MQVRENIAISDSGFVFDANTGESFVVNSMGLEIIQLLKKGQDKEQIEKNILEKYEVDAITLERDYFDYLGMLQRFNFFN